MVVALWGFIGQNSYTQSKTTSQWSHKLTIHYDWVSPNPYLGQPITNRWCKPTGCHVSYATDISTATRLGLCSSLVHRWVSVIASNSGKLMPNILTSAVPLHHPDGSKTHYLLLYHNNNRWKGATLDQGKLSKWPWILNVSSVEKTGRRVSVYTHTSL